MLTRLHRFAVLSSLQIQHDPVLEYVKQSRRSDIQEVKLVVKGETKLVFAAAYGMSSIANIVRKLKQGKCKYHYIEIMACPKGCNNGGGQIKPVALPGQNGNGLNDTAGAGAGAAVGSAAQSAVAASPAASTVVTATGAASDGGSSAFGEGGAAAAGVNADTTAAAAAAAAAAPVIETNVALLNRVDALYASLPLEDSPEENVEVQHLYRTWLNPDAGGVPTAAILRTSCHHGTNSFAAPIAWRMVTIEHTAYCMHILLAIDRLP